MSLKKTKPAKNMKILYDLSAVDDIHIIESLRITNGNMDNALFLLFKNKNV